MGGGDGMGPKGDGPMTGRGQGICILKIDNDKPSIVEGFTGINGTPVRMARDESMAGCFKNTKKEVDMPGGDRTGPMGTGAMTGRAMGNCVGNTGQGYVTPGVRLRQGGGGQMGVGRGRGAGRGRGFRQGGQMGFGLGRGGVAPYEGNAPYSSSPAMPTREQELEMLESQAEEFQGALTDIQQRISEMESDSGEEK